ncbi:hypothetical protein J6590_001807 [Homalodisca vitripennis]|nr:hypothetical protein J6590_001807 [Homalodisca vitripennis]
MIFHKGLDALCHVRPLEQKHSTYRSMPHWPGRGPEGQDNPDDCNSGVCLPVNPLPHRYDTAGKTERCAIDVYGGQV